MYIFHFLTTKNAPKNAWPGAHITPRTPLGRHGVPVIATGAKGPVPHPCLEQRGAAAIGSIGSMGGYKVGPGSYQL